MGQYPMGGMAWQVLHYVLGFKRLGCECYYVECSGAPPYSPRLNSIGTDARENIRFVRDTFRRLDLGGAWAYYDCISRGWYGLQELKARDLIEHSFPPRVFEPAAGSATAWDAAYRTFRDLIR